MKNQAEYPKLRKLTKKEAKKLAEKIQIFREDKGSLLKYADRIEEGAKDLFLMLGERIGVVSFETLWREADHIETAVPGFSYSGKKIKKIVFAIAKAVYKNNLKTEKK